MKGKGAEFTELCHKSGVWRLLGRDAAAGSDLAKRMVLLEKAAEIHCYEGLIAQF